MFRRQRVLSDEVVNTIWADAKTSVPGGRERAEALGVEALKLYDTVNRMYSAGRR